MNEQLTVFKASAGSGKTFRLAVEYIKQLIRNPLSYKHILAVTFTNKATAEMKNRIVSQLYGITNRCVLSEPYLKTVVCELGVSEYVVCENARIALKNLLHDYNYFKVQTIDTFFQSVLRNLARELDLTTNLRVELNDVQIMERAVEELIESLDKETNEFRWILDYVIQNMEADKSWNVINELKSFGKNIYDYSYKTNSEELTKLLNNEDKFKDYKDTLYQIKEKETKTLKTYGNRFIEIIHNHGYEVDSFSKGKSGIAGYFIKLGSGIFKQKEVVNKTLNMCLDDAKKWITKSKPNYDDLLNLVETELQPLLREAEIQRCKLWPQINSAAITLQHLNKLRLLNTIEKKVRAINAMSNTFLLSDTQYVLNRIIDQSDSPFIYEKIGAQLKHIMIDEFQDTSIIQWENFKVLLNDTMSHAINTDRGMINNMIVGDVKQSIYRWRNGDWHLLNNIQTEFNASTQMIKIDESLTMNRRSSKNIITFNNIFFQHAAEIEYQNEQSINRKYAEELKTAYKSVSQSIPEGNHSKGLVRIELLPSSNKDECMMNAMIKHIDRLLANGIEPRKIAILIRSNKIIPIMADFFSRCRPNIRIVSDEAFKLEASKVINLLITALRFLINPNDLLSKAILDKSMEKNEDNVFTTEMLSTYREKFLRMPFFNLLESVYNGLQLDRIAGQTVYLCRFYDVVTKFIHEQGTDIEAFLNEWDERLHKESIPSQDIDGIRVISIHKSKGLEFDNVIVPYCDWKMDLSTTLWCPLYELKEKGKPFNYLPVVPVNLSGTLQESIYQKYYQQEHLQNCVDNLNLLYVAFTRARRNLFIIGQRDESKNYRSNLLQRVLESLQPQELDGACLNIPNDKNQPITFEYGSLEIGEYTQKSDDNVFTVTEKPIDMKRFSYPMIVNFKQSNGSRAFHAADDLDLKQSSYIQTGTTLHSIFSNIKTLDDINKLIRKISFEGVSSNDINIAKLDQLLKQISGNPLITDWFSGHWNVFNECTILWTDTQGKPLSKRPDRVMSDGNRVVIVDYKFGKPLEEHVQQVQLYKQLLFNMGYQSVEGYLWYVYQNKVRKV